MLLYHIADTHFGKSINGTSLIEDQRCWVNRFIEKCDEVRPDAILIAGDLYDRVNPGGEAVKLLSDMLTELDSRDIPVFMIAGNHDSGPKVEFGKDILAKRNIHIAGTVTRQIVHYTMDDPDGFGPVTFWLVPFVFPEKIAVLFEDNNIRSYSDALTRLLSEQDIDTSHRNVIISHQNVVAHGVEVEYGGSETSTGGVGPVEYTVYDDFDYVALGHIHSGLSVGRSSIRYAGTPLCYHFDETRYSNKGIVKVELGRKGDEINTSIIPIAPLHVMHPISGTREEVYDEVLNRVGESEYVAITLTDMRVTSEVSDYLRAVITGRNGMLLETLSTFNEFNTTGAAASIADVSRKNVEVLFADFYKTQMGGQDPSAEENAFLEFLGELVRNNTESTPEEDVQKALDKLRENGEGGNA